MRTGVIAVTVGSLLFAVNGTVAKIAMDRDLTSVQLVTYRSLGSAVVLLCLAMGIRRQAMRLPWREIVQVAILGVLGVAMVQWLYLVAISRLDVGLALLLEFTAPLLIAVWTWAVRREAVHARTWAALATSLVGLGMVAQVSGGGLDPVGVLAGFGAAAGLAAFYLLGHRRLAVRDPLSTYAWSMLWAALFWSAITPPWALPWGTMTSRVQLPDLLDGFHPPLLLLVLWVVVLGTVIPYLLTLVGIRSLGATKAGLLGMLEPVGAATVAWVVLGESMTVVQVIGAVVVLVSVGVAQTAPVPVTGAGAAGGDLLAAAADR